MPPRMTPVDAHKLVRIEQSTTDRNKQTVRTSAARIVADVCHNDLLVASELAARYFRNLFECY